MNMQKQIMQEQQIKNYSLSFFPKKQQEQSNSQYKQKQQENQFLDDVFYYESCPHCTRKFFQGKLKYHLKLCKSENPMVKSPLKKVKRNLVISALEEPKKQSNAQEVNQINNFKQNRTYQRCEKCKVKFPIFLIQKHQQKCSPGNSRQNPQNIQIKSHTRINFKISQQLALPRIQNSAKQHKFSQKRKLISDISQLGEYTVRIRQDLSCFTKAKQVQKVECNFCGRKFSKQASLRHIPICQNIKCKQKNSIILKFKSQQKSKKHSISKSDLYKSNFNQKNMPDPGRSKKIYL